ncbi:MAG TPA: efflux RND transporter periplasmic adaptor subunit [Vicinamibacterales bacterium]|nr:efflux RND transporter periplasmic adaptor subunit [Vicinamibacterales bacterium]
MYRCVQAALLLSLSAAAGCSDTGSAQSQGNAPSPPKVTTVTVRADSVRRAIDIVGTLAAAEEVTVSSEVEGKVSRIGADLGDRVRAGDVLVELDREKLEYRYEASRAALERARARYGADAAGTLPTLETTPDVQKAAADLAQAEQAVTRARALARRGLVANQQLDDAEARYLAAKAGYDAAVQNARNLRADVDAGAAQMRLARRELRDAQVRAPFDGYIQRRIVSPGMFVRVQTPVMSLVKVDPLKLTGEVPERLAPWVRIGQPVELRVDAYPDRVMSGTISRISPAVNQQTRAFPLEAAVPNPDGRLKPGTFARARIVSDRIDRVLAVPVGALQYRYGVNRVFVLKGDRIAAREVKTGDRLGDRMEITSGIAAGDVIVAGGVEQLADGLRVAPARGE